MTDPIKQKAIRIDREEKVTEIEERSKQTQKKKKGESKRLAN